MARAMRVCHRKLDLFARLVSLALLLWTFSASAFELEGFIRGSDDKPASNKTISMNFYIIQEPANPNDESSFCKVYSELGATVQTDALGSFVYSVNSGAITPAYNPAGSVAQLFNSANAIACDGGGTMPAGSRLSAYMLFSVPTSGGSEVVKVGPSSLAPVPYAERASQADQVGEHSSASLVRVEDGTTAPVAVSSLDLTEFNALKDWAGKSSSDYLLKANLGSEISSSMITTKLGFTPLSSAVSNVSAAVGGPISVVNGSTAPTISIAQAGASQAGFLSVADWNAFNNKQPAGAYLTGITPAQVLGALMYTPVNRTGDTMTGTLNLPNGGLAVGTGQFVVKSDGKVGIGTTSPGAELEVAGQLKITGGFPGAGKVLQSDANGLAVWATPGGAESTSVSNIGTAGVGVYKQMTGSSIELKKINAGSSALSVFDDTGSNELDIDLANLGVATGKIANNAVTYEKFQDISTNNRLLGRATTGAGDAEEITLGTGLSFSGTTLNVSAGTVTNVDVGGSPLSVTNTSTTPTISIAQATSGAAGFLTSTDWISFNNKVNRAGDTMSGTLNLPSNGLVVGSNQLVVSSSKVGIGTSGPSSPLSVQRNSTSILADFSGNNSSGTGIKILNSNDINAYSYLQFWSGAAEQWEVGGSASDFYIYDGQAGVNRLTIKNGNVGIGTTTPGQKLEVAGNIKGTQLCIGGDCRATWPAAGLSVVGTAEITDNTIRPGDLNFADPLAVNKGIVVRDDSGNFHKKTCSSGNDVLIWTVASGWICSAVVLAEADPQVGSNTTNVLSKWDGSALVGSAVFESAGKVGIGSTTPGYPLDVNGTVRATSFIGSGSLLTGVTASAYAGTLGVMNGGTGAGSLTGFVYGNGVGAMTASTTISGGAISGNIPGNAANVTGTVAVGNGGTGSTTGSITGTGALTFAAGSGNNNVTLTPSGTGYTVLNGNVGIGTTSPTSLLHVNGETKVGTLCVGSGPCRSALAHSLVPTRRTRLTTIGTYSFVPSAGTKVIYVTVVGAGGGGGAAFNPTVSSYSNVGSGGGSGAIVRRWFNYTGGNATVVVGASGNAGIYNVTPSGLSQGDGVAGGDTSFNYGGVEIRGAGGEGGRGHISNSSTGARNGGRGGLPFVSSTAEPYPELIHGQRGNSSLVVSNDPLLFGYGASSMYGTTTRSVGSIPAGQCISGLTGDTADFGAGGMGAICDQATQVYAGNGAAGRPGVIFIEEYE